jgi:ribosomal protein RSM22 (predicted rRNA methylase)
MIQYAALFVEALNRPRLTGCPAFAGHDGQRMTSPDLPAELKAALDGKLRGFSRNDAAGRAARSQRPTATAAAPARSARRPMRWPMRWRGCLRHTPQVTASLNALVGIRPDFAPENLLDVGAGPGTATWAAAEAFPSLQGFTLLDANDALRALALGLVTDSFRLREVSYERGEARASLPKRMRQTSSWRAT